MSVNFQIWKIGCQILRLCFCLLLISHNWRCPAGSGIDGGFHSWSCRRPSSRWSQQRRRACKWRLRILGGPGKWWTIIDSKTIKSMTLCLCRQEFAWCCHQNAPHPSLGSQSLLPFLRPGRPKSCSELSTAQSSHSAAYDQKQPNQYH